MGSALPLPPRVPVMQPPASAHAPGVLARFCEAELCLACTSQRLGTAPQQCHRRQCALGANNLVQWVDMPPEQEPR